jgi:hypothetical protein
MVTTDRRTSLSFDPVRRSNECRAINLAVVGLDERRGDSRCRRSIMVAALERVLARPPEAWLTRLNERGSVQ